MYLKGLTQSFNCCYNLPSHDPSSNEIPNPVSGSSNFGIKNPDVPKAIPMHVISKLAPHAQNNYRNTCVEKMLDK